MDVFGIWLLLYYLYDHIIICNIYIYIYIYIKYYMCVYVCILTSTYIYILCRVHDIYIYTHVQTNLTSSEKDIVRSFFIGGHSMSSVGNVAEEVVIWYIVGRAP